MKSIKRPLAALLTLFSITALFAAQVDEIDLGAFDDSADAAAARPIVSAANKDPGFVDITCDESTIADVLRQFRKVTKANIINADSTNLNRRVSVRLENVPWFDALRSILNSRGFRIEERNNIYYVEESINKPITRSYILSHASAEELADLFNGYRLKAEKTVNANGRTEESVKSIESAVSALGGRVRASAFPNANVLVISGYEPELIECEAIIKAIDRAAQQVYIEARFMELSSEAKHELGLKWDSMKQVGLTSSDNQIGNDLSLSRDSTLNDLFKNLGDTQASYSGNYSGTLSATDFSLFLSAFEEIGGSQIFSNPRVIISNGKEAVIDMTTKFPNLRITSQRNTASGQTYTDYTAQLEEIRGDLEKGLFAGSSFFSWGISLSVKPRISPDGLISVKITPSISELDKEISSDGFYQVQGGSSGDEKKDEAAYGKYPIIRMKSIATDFTMKDGCTAVIGGLSRTEEDDVDNGIPGLRSIPWIGPRLFGWKSRAKVQKEIIICVTIGIANPSALQKDAGLPKNAVLSREYVEGRRQEPGDRPNAANDAKKLDKLPLDSYNRTHEKDDDEIDLEQERPRHAAPNTLPARTRTRIDESEVVEEPAAAPQEPVAETAEPGNVSEESAEAPRRTRSRRH